MLIMRFILHTLSHDSDDDGDFSYEARVDEAVGEEGLHIDDILPGTGTYTGECISRNVIGEFTGDLTEEQATCITHTTKEKCIEPCLWYTPETKNGVDEDLADIDDESKVCAREPVNGVCAPGFELGEDGCCALPASELPSVGAIVLDIGLEIAKGEACGLIIALSPAILKFLAGEGLTPGAAKAMKRAFKAMKMAKTGAKVVIKLQTRLATRAGIRFGIAKVGRKIVGNTVGSVAVRQAAKATAKLAAKMGAKMGATMAARAAAKILSMAAKASSVIAAPLLIFDIFSMALDMGDPRGYNTFAENAVIQQARQVSEYELQKFAQEQEIEYPFTFPLTTAFPAAWDTVVTPALEKRYLHTAMMRLTEEHIMLVFEALLDDTDFPEDVTNAIGVNLMEEMNRDPNDRDDEVYRVLTTGQVVTGTRWIDTGRSKPVEGRQITDANFIQLLQSKVPVATTNLGLARAVKRFAGLLNSIPFMSTEEDMVNPFTDDIRLTLEEVPTKSSGKPFKFDAYTYVELNGKYYVSSDIGVPGRLIHRCAHMTTAVRQGVSLSMEGVKWWNAWHKEEWFKYNDLFQRPPDMPENYEAPPVALWSTEYLVLDEENPGTSDKPNMKVRKLSKPAALYLPAGHIVAYCEKKRDAAFFGGLLGQEVPDMNSGVDPTDYGVYFDDGTGDLGGIGCVYTAKYCTRMGLKHKYNHQSKESDCFMDGGQEVSEFIFGTTVTRGVYEGAHNLLGFVCDPECNVTEYCEGRKCYPKQEYGKSVGITAGWKCLSGAEDMGKCAECDVGEDCDGYTTKTSQKKIECSNGSCFCEHGKCNLKREVGDTVGVTAGWKCLSGLEAFAKCVVCKGGLGAGNASCDALHGKTHVVVDQKTGGKERIGKKYCEGDKCHDRKGIGSNVGFTAGWKCTTGREINGRCHAGEGSLPHGTDVAFNNGKYCERGMEDMGKCVECKTNIHCDAITDTVDGHNCTGGKCFCEHGKCNLKREVGDTVGVTAGWKCLSGLEAFAKCVVCKGGLGAGNASCDALHGKTHVVVDQKTGGKERIGKKYCEGDKCHDRKGIGSNVGFTAGWKCTTGREINGRCHAGEGSLPHGTDVAFNNGKYCERGMEDMGKCVECKTNIHCDAITDTVDGHNCTGGKCFCEHGKCNLKREVGDTVGVTAGWKCLSGLEAFAKCVVCKGGLGAGNAACDTAYPDKDGKLYCEGDKCHDKKGTGANVGVTAGWKCLSGLEAFAKCVECKGGLGAGNASCDALHGKTHVVVDQKTGGKERIGKKYCEGDKCHDRKGVGSNVGFTAGWKCTTGREINGRCHAGEGSLNPGTDVGYNNGKYCKPMGRVSGGAEEGGKCMGQCKGDQTNVGGLRGKFCCSGTEVGGYCVSKSRSLDNGKKPGVGQGKWCKSSHEHWGTCVQCKSDEHCGGGQKCIDNVCKTPVHCAGDWSACSGPCNDRKKTYHRTRNEANGGNGNCPRHGDKQACASTPCANGKGCGGDNGCASGVCHWGTCRQCRDDGKCGNGQKCIDNVCKTPVHCAGHWSACSGPCTDRKKTYHRTRNEANGGNGNCPRHGDKQACASTPCANGKGCGGDNGCASGVCHWGTCRQCRDDGKCGNGQKCIDAVCKTPVHCAGHWSACSGPCNHRKKTYHRTRNEANGGNGNCPRHGDKQACASTPCGEGIPCGGDGQCTSGRCHHGRCTSSRDRAGNHHCAWWNGDACPHGKSCHHEWCIRM